ncbi:Pycsar system effector family protein [Saccharothrix hoggarensis]|uniref:Pycsar system effector family protein n=1 Tax=Saccharothrix hoggarensis TaxID=913853 RepID=A0ABW3QTL1_9PSEU
MREDEPKDAYQAIGQFSGWVANADTKAGLLATATTLLGGGLASQRHTIRDAFRPSSLADWVSLVAISVAMVAILVTAIALVLVLVPRARVARQTRFSRFSWPAVAAKSMDELLAEVDAKPAEEAWWTARDLAIIVHRKVRWLRVALFGWVIGALGLLAWVVVLK